MGTSNSGDQLAAARRLGGSGEPSATVQVRGGGQGTIAGVDRGGQQAAPPGGALPILVTQQQAQQTGSFPAQLEVDKGGEFVLFPQPGLSFENAGASAALQGAVLTCLRRVPRNGIIFLATQRGRTGASEPQPGLVQPRGPTGTGRSVSPPVVGDHQALHQTEQQICR